MKALERRQALLELLCERRYEKMANLAFEFGVSRQTIQNDVLELSLSYPIYTSVGNSGGVYVQEDYYLGKTYLSYAQEELLKRLYSTCNDADKKTLQSIIKKFGKQTGGK